jgi:hypothetical protein
MLRPEKQDIEAFADGVNNIVEAQTRVALDYFADGSVDAAIPPLKALLHIMAYGNYEGKPVSHPDIRNMFEREYVLSSEWYKERLLHKQQIDIAFLEKSLQYLDDFMKLEVNQEYTTQLNLHQRKANLAAELEHVKSDNYLEFLEGTIGADLLFTKA